MFCCGEDSFNRRHQEQETFKTYSPAAMLPDLQFQVKIGKAIITVDALHVTHVVIQFDDMEWPTLHPYGHT